MKNSSSEDVSFYSVRDENVEHDKSIDSFECWSVAQMGADRITVRDTFAADVVVADRRHETVDNGHHEVAAEDTFHEVFGRFGHATLKLDENHLAGVGKGEIHEGNGFLSRARGRRPQEVVFCALATAAGGNDDEEHRARDDDRAASNNRNHRQILHGARLHRGESAQRDGESEGARARATHNLLERNRARQVKNCDDAKEIEGDAASNERFAQGPKGLSSDVRENFRLGQLAVEPRVAVAGYQRGESNKGNEEVKRKIAESRKGKRKRQHSCSQERSDDDKCNLRPLWLRFGRLEILRGAQQPCAQLVLLHKYLTQALQGDDSGTFLRCRASLTRGVLSYATASVR